MSDLEWLKTKPKKRASTRSTSTPTPTQTPTIDLTVNNEPLAPSAGVDVGMGEEMNVDVGDGMEITTSADENQPRVAET